MVQGDAYTNDISQGGLGFSTEYHIGIKGKINLPLLPITPIAFVDYYRLSGEEAVPQGTIEISQSIVSAGAGVEYSLAPGPINPYVTVTVASNSFSKLDVTTPAGYTGAVPSGDGVTRVGAGIGLGLDISIIPSLDVDATVSYNWLNLIGKESGEETVRVINLDVAVALVSM